MPIVLAATTVPIAIALVVAMVSFVALLPLLGVSVATMTGNRGADTVPERAPGLVPVVEPLVVSAQTATPATAPASAPVVPSVVPRMEPVMQPARTLVPEHELVPDRGRVARPGRGLRIALAATVLVTALVPVLGPARWGGRRTARAAQRTGASA